MSRDIGNETLARRLVYARSGGRCEVCGINRGCHWHHRKNRSQGGRWVASNGLHLCVYCHKKITEGPTAAYDHGWSVRSGFDPADEKVQTIHGVVRLADDGSFRPAVSGVAA